MLPSLATFSCIPFPVSLQVHSFHHESIELLLGGRFSTHTKGGMDADRGPGGQRCSSSMGISRTNMHANDSTVSAFAAQVSTFSKRWVRDKIRRPDVVAVRPNRVSCRSQTPYAIPTNWSRCLASRSYGQDQEFADASHLHVSDSELVHDPWSEGFED
jgi:hypothetical protein